MVRKQILVSILITTSFVLLTGIVFPIFIWSIAQVAFPSQANGSFYERNGTIVGSELIGQIFSSARYFHPRPSAAGSGYDASASGGTNLGPTSQKLFAELPAEVDTNGEQGGFESVAMLAKSYRIENGLDTNSLVPVDAVTRSGSGLDPHISLLNASLQAQRITKERGLKLEQVKGVILHTTEERFLGIFGEPRVNVLRLNIALDALTPSRR